MTTILFWDIDGTLINSNGAGRLALTQAVCELIGEQVDLASIKMAGMTDWAIATEILQYINLRPEPENILQLLQLYQQHLPISLKTTQGYVIAGIKEILHRLESCSEVISLLLTGNIEAGAWMKLSHYGLEGYFQGGGFCQSTLNRTDIAHQALALAKSQIGTVDLNQCYVIGDTPHDVRCGQAIGAKTITIASPHYSVQDLKECNSDLVWESFPDPVSFWESITGDRSEDIILRAFNQD